MKLNKNFFTVLTSNNMLIMAILLGVMIGIMTFYPKASWIHMTIGSVVLLAVNALLLLKDKNQEAILSEINESLKSIGGGGIPKPKEEKP